MMMIQGLVFEPQTDFEQQHCSSNAMLLSIVELFVASMGLHCSALA